MAGTLLILCLGMYNIHDFSGVEQALEMSIILDIFQAVENVQYNIRIRFISVVPCRMEPQVRAVQHI